MQIYNPNMTWFFKENFDRFFLRYRVNNILYFLMIDVSYSPFTFRGFSRWLIDKSSYYFWSFWDLLFSDSLIICYRVTEHVTISIYLIINYYFLFLNFPCQQRLALSNQNIFIIEFSLTTMFVFTDSWELW